MNDEAQLKQRQGPPPASLTTREKGLLLGLAVAAFLTAFLTACSPAGDGAGAVRLLLAALALVVLAVVGFLGLGLYAYIAGCGAALTAPEGAGATALQEP